MSTLLDRVFQGADGSAHFLSSTPDRSVLIITDPVLGKDEITFDGPVRLLPPRAGSGAVEYESISASGSTTVQVSPGQEPFYPPRRKYLHVLLLPAGRSAR